MRVMLVLNSEKARDVRVIVRLQKDLKSKVRRLIEQDKNREAFDLMTNRAMVESYVPEGSSVMPPPEMTLIEGQNGAVVNVSLN